MYLDFAYDICESQIKSTKRILRINYGLLIFNFILLAMNGAFVYTGTGNITNSIALGAVLINVVWTLGYILEYRSDLKLDRLRLKRMEEHKDDKNLQEAIKFHKSSQELYEKAYTSLLAQNTGKEQKSGESHSKESEKFGKSHSGVQSAF